MATTCIGYPRIGAFRELKFAIEKYWRGEVDERTLHETAAELRRTQRAAQKAAGMDYVPVNDFSYYDGMLDLCFMLGAVPKQYQMPGLSELDVYFAMARGYQGEKGDVKALAMKKWFNTNYHYLVPELDDETTFSLHAEKLFAAVEEAVADGVAPRPVSIGPFTFLKLAHCLGTKQAADYADDVAEVFAQLLRTCDARGVKWIQLDEPILVTDQNAADKALFTSLYEKILPAKGHVQVLLQTYFGDIRDCYEEVVGLDVAAVGLDFIEGRQTAELVKEYGFPADKYLFAGIVNGKNIWRCDYAKALANLRLVKSVTDKVVLNTSCSLLHVPYTVTSEEQLPASVSRYFAFAREKLDELKTLDRLAQDPDYENVPAYRENQTLLATPHSDGDAGVRERTAALRSEDFTRPTPRDERQTLQRRMLNLPSLPTTTIGSFPQTAAVRKNRNRFRKGEIDKATYDAAVEGFIKDCIRLQEDIGLDVLVHGEFERNDMVEFFGENLDGFIFTRFAWVQSYGTRCVKPPIIFSDVKRTRPITVPYSVYANGLTERDVKGMLTGPVTILNWSFPREDVPLKESAYQIGLAIQEEVLDLEAAGIRIIQIDEAALREKLPLRRADWHSEYLDWALAAFRLCHSGVRDETQIHTHMCYSEFNDIIEDIDAMDADVITFEASRSKLTILDELKACGFETEVGPGVYDIHSPRVPAVEEIEAALRLMIDKVGAEKLWVNPDCGLKTRGPAETEASLRNLVAAAKRVRDTL